MAVYDLPTSVTIGGREYEVRSDFRAILDVMEVMADADLTDEERGGIALTIFYPDVETIPQEDLEDAAERLMWFVRGGDGREPGGRRIRLMDWSQDFQLVVAPVNRVLGLECRAQPYLHWWTFLNAYYEIGDCLFAQVVAIRKKLKTGKKLDKQEREFYRDNHAMVDLKTRETAAEAETFDAWLS